MQINESNSKRSKNPTDILCCYALFRNREIRKNKDDNIQKKAKQYKIMDGNTDKVI